MAAEVPKLVEAVVDIGLNLTHRSFAGIVPDVVRRATVPRGRPPTPMPCPVTRVTHA